MDSSSNNAIRFTSDDTTQNGSAPNWYVLLFAVIITLFAVYWGFIRPTSRQLTKMRRYVTSLEKSIADLNGQSNTTGETLSLLDQLVRQGQVTSEAVKALSEMRELHRQVVYEANQLRSARQALQKLAALRTDVARQSALVDETDQALDTLQDLHGRIRESADDSSEAVAALVQINLLRDGLVESIHRIEETKPVVDKVEELHARLVGSNEQTKKAWEVSENLLAIEEELLSRGGYTQSAQLALDDLIDLRDQVEAQAAQVQKADATLDHMVQLQDDIISRTDIVANAIETLELSADIQQQMQRAGNTFDGVKRMLTELVMIQPSLQEAMKSLQPLQQLSDLRRLNVHQLRQVVEVVTNRHAAIALDTSGEQAPSEVVADASETTVK